VARASGRPAALVGAGIFLSRIAGLIRQRVFAHYLGLYDEADALNQSFRIPNLLQNLFGESMLSASFIPVYARLVGQQEHDRAGKVAGAVLGLLATMVSLVVLAGVLATPLVVNLLAPGFEGHKRMLTISLVRILFPSTGLLVLSAWCLAVLNSHGKFFLSYAAPVVWNAAIIVTAIVAAAGHSRAELVVWIAWGAVAGSALQVLVQLPTVMRVLAGFKLAVRTTTPEVRTVVKNFWPALMSRGANQISAYVDGVIASLLGRGAVAALVNAQLLNTLPVSLFGMAVSASELTTMSAAIGEGEVRHAVLRQRLTDGSHRIAYFVVPCAVGFLALGHVIAGAVFQTGRFTAADSRYVWAILAGSAVGLLAATLSRLSASAFFALGDTRTPLRCAIVRVLLTIVLGAVFALVLPPVFGIDKRWGAVGLTATAGFAAWVEYALLRSRLAGVIGPAGFDRFYLARLYLAAVLAAGAGWGALLLLAGRQGPLVTAAASLIPFAAVYGAVTLAFGIPTARAIAAQARRRG
jgi:putative peptidoglycan lipid II flippase